MRNPIREKLGRGELVLGMMHFTGSPMLAVGEKISTDYARQITARGVQVISFSADALVFLKACRDIASLKSP